MTTFSLHDLHDEYLKMMFDFHSFCVENHLTYYMVGGTLLGAIRNRGFIPWDDDVDFAMPRKDYEVFLRLYKGTLKLYNFKSDRRFPFVYTKLINTHYPVAHLLDKQYSFDSTVFVQIDVYPIDDIGQEYKCFFKKSYIVNMLKKIYFIKKQRTVSKSIFKRFLKLFLWLLPSRFLLFCIDFTMKKHLKTNSSLITRWRNKNNRTLIFEKHVFGKPCLYSFENLLFYGPERPQNYLSLIYGDYSIAVKENINPRHSTGVDYITCAFSKILSEDFPQVFKE